MGRRARGAAKISAESTATVLSAALAALVKNKAARRTVATTAAAIVRALRHDGSQAERPGRGRACSTTSKVAVEVDQADEVAPAVVANVQNENRKREKVRRKRAKARARKRDAKAAKFAVVAESAPASDAVMVEADLDTDLVPVRKKEPSFLESGDHGDQNRVPGSPTTYQAELLQQLKNVNVIFEAVNSDVILLLERTQEAGFNADQERLYNEKQAKLVALAAERSRLEEEVEKEVRSQDEKVRKKQRY